MAAPRTMGVRLLALYILLLLLRVHRKHIAIVIAVHTHLDGILIGSLGWPRRYFMQHHVVGWLVG